MATKGRTKPKIGDLKNCKTFKVGSAERKACVAANAEIMKKKRKMVSDYKKANPGATLN